MWTLRFRHRNAGKEHELVVVPEADHGFQGQISGGKYIMNYERHLEPEKEVFIEE